MDGRSVNGYYDETTVCQFWKRKAHTTYYIREDFLKAIKHSRKRFRLSFIPHETEGFLRSDTLSFNTRLSVYYRTVDRLYNTY